MNIKITAKEAQPAVQDYRRRQGQSSASEGVQGGRPFSHEAFVDAIVEWIVADDQVFLFSLIRSHPDVPPSVD
jgi:hypothetical protein